MTKFRKMDGNFKKALLDEKIRILEKEYMMSKFKNNYYAEIALGWNENKVISSNQPLLRLAFLGDAMLGLGIEIVKYMYDTVNFPDESKDYKENKFIAKLETAYVLLRRELLNDKSVTEKSIKSAIERDDKKSFKPLPDVVEATIGAKFIDCKWNFDKTLVTIIHLYTIKGKRLKNQESLINPRGEDLDVINKMRDFIKLDNMKDIQDGLNFSIKCVSHYLTEGGEEERKKLTAIGEEALKFATVYYLCTGKIKSNMTRDDMTTIKNNLTNYKNLVDIFDLLISPLINPNILKKFNSDETYSGEKNENKCKKAKTKLDKFKCDTLKSIVGLVFIRSHDFQDLQKFVLQLLEQTFMPNNNGYFVH